MQNKFLDGTLKVPSFLIFPSQFLNKSSRKRLGSYSSIVGFSDYFTHFRWVVTKFVTIHGLWISRS